MRRNSPWFFMVFLAVAYGGSAANHAMAEVTDTPAAEPAVTWAPDQELACVVMGETDGRPSPLQEVRFTYEGGEGLLCYGAPSARGREIIGGLVPFGQPWRIGANEPTTLHLSAPTTVGGVSLDAGSYSLYAIPGESEWEFFINSNFERWGIPINADVRSTEIGSFTVTVAKEDEMVEALTYEHMAGHFMLTWENTHLHIPIGG